MPACRFAAFLILSMKKYILQNISIQINIIIELNEMESLISLMHSAAARISVARAECVQMVADVPADAREERAEESLAFIDAGRAGLLAS